MSRNTTDSRQITLRAFLQQIANAASYAGTADAKAANTSELDNLLQAIDDELQPLLRLSASSTPDLIVAVGPSTKVNSESSRTRSISHIGALLPNFSSGTVTFPASSGGTITVSPGNNGTLTVASGNYIKVLIYLDATGSLNVLPGVEDAVEATASVLKVPIDTLPIGYVTLQNVAGTIQNITQSKIYQFNIGAGVTNTAIDSEFLIKDVTDPTKQLAFDAAGTTGTKTTIAGSQTANRILTLPDATDTVAALAATQALSNKQISYSSSSDATTTGSNASLQAFTSGIVRLTNGSVISVSGIPAGNSGQILILENKTGNPITINNEETTPTAANRIQTGSGGNISMANNATFTFTYDTTSSRWQLTGGSGSGSGSGGGKNYLSAITTSQSSTPNTGNGDFENGSTAGWSKVHSTLDSVKLPNQASGSWTSASGNLTISAITSGRLAGSYSGQLQQTSGSSVAGDMLISDAFYIDSQDQNKVLGFKFYYNLTAGAANTDFSGTSSNSFGVAFYDVTNGAWIQPSGVYGLTQNSGTGICTGSFQTNGTATQYRMALYFPNASTGTFTLVVDDFSFGPQSVSNGAAMTDWTSYTPSLIGITNGLAYSNTTLSGKYRQVGDSYEVRITTYFTGTPGTGTGEFKWTLPNGATIDTSDLVGVFPSVGRSLAVDSGTAFRNGMITTTAANTGVGIISNGGLTYWSPTVPNTWTTNDIIELDFMVPIVGKSSNVQLSSDTDTRVVAMRAYKNGGTLTVQSTFQDVASYTTDFDSHGGFNATTGIYTVPVSGKYSVAWCVALDGNAAGVGFSLVLKGSAGICYGSSPPNNTLIGIVSNGSCIINCVAGDTIKIQGWQSSAATLAYQSANHGTQLNIERLSGPSVIAASESVSAKYTGNDSSSLSTTPVVVKGLTLAFDSHGIINPTTGAITIPVSGIYEMTVQASCNALSTAGNQYFNFQLRTGAVANAGTIKENAYQRVAASGSYSSMPTYTFTLKCLAGEVYSFQAISDIGASRALQNEGFIAVKRVGN